MKARKGQEEQGQAMVEFAMIASLFFLVLFAIVEVGLFWAPENMAATHATEIGVETAVEAPSINCISSTTPCPPGIGQVATVVLPELQAAMIGTPVRACTFGALNSSPCQFGNVTLARCPTDLDIGPEEVWNLNKKPLILLCSEVAGDRVTVSVMGYANAFFGHPPLFSVKGIPISSTATVTELAYQK